VYTVHSSMAVAAYEWSAVPDGATKLPFTLTPLPANSNSSSSNSLRKLGGGAVTNSVSVTMSSSSSSSSSCISFDETDYSGEGVPAVSNCCFGLVVGSKSRRTTTATTTAANSTVTATTKATTSSDSSSVSALVSCGYWDNSVRVHSLASDSKSSSSSSAAYAQQCCAAEGAHTGVVTCLSASDGGLMVT
jgi:hypothetical protein